MMTARQESYKTTKEQRGSKWEYERLLGVEINQVEQRITNLRQSLNAELDSLLNVLQHLKKFEHGANPNLESIKRSGSSTRSQSEVQPEAWEHIPDVLHVKDLQNILNIGRNQAYDLVNSKVFHHVRIGRLMLIPKRGFVAWLEGDNQR